MSDNTTLQRPEVLDTLSDTQMKELEFQAEEYDKEEFFRVAATYGWDDGTVEDVWKWSEVQNLYPLEPADQ